MPEQLLEGRFSVLYWLMHYLNKNVLFPPSHKYTETRVKLHCIEMKLTLPAVSCVLEKVVFAIKQNVGTVAICGAVI